MNFDKPDSLDFLPQNGISQAPNSITENLTGAFDATKYTGGTGSNSKNFTLLDVWSPIVEELNSTGNEFENPAIWLFENSPTRYRAKTEEIYSYIEQNSDWLPVELGKVNPQFLDDTMKSFVENKEAEMAELVRNNPGFIRGAARFVGGMGTAFGDPVTLYTMPFGGWSKTLWKNIAQSAAINAGAGAITELDVKEWYDELGLEYSYEDFIKNVGMQAAFGAAMPAAGAAIRMTGEQGLKGWNVLKNKLQKPLDIEDQAIVDALDNQADIESSNPLQSPNSIEAEFEHEARLSDASAAVRQGEIPRIPSEPTSPISPQAAQRSVDNLDGVIYDLDPMDIEVDAKTFQFKEGGDEFGVTERLQGITTWDKYKAGTVTVYEYADGRMAIADGHQRLGLAKRIRSQDPSQDIRVFAYKLRETDGITPPEARVIAAMKNIAEGTGTSIDAAKVLRVDPSRISELPPRSELVRQARDMMGLSDTAFGAVVNGVVPPNYGAIVGRLIDDEGLQDAAIEVLAKADPSNAFQAEAIVRQVRESDADQVEQISLFGEELVTESLYVERAKVLDRAYKELRRDKAAFETLVRNSERLEAEGNVLVKDVNQRKANTDAQTIALLQTLANRKGPLSDALNDAARTARDTNSYVAATGGFLDAVRGAIESGDFDRVSTGDIGRAVDGAPEITRSQVTDEPALEGFDEPSGVASERQADQLIADMFGADEIEPGSLQDLSRLLDQNPTREQIDNHPSVLSALDEIASRPDTVKIDGYDSDDWHNSRVYKINGEDVVSTDEAMLRFERDAEALAFKELNLDVEPVLANKELTIVLGPPAAGKSTIANELAISNRSAILDSDEIKKTLPEYEGGVGASAVHEESSNLAKELQALMIERGTNIVLPKVGHSASSIRDVISLYKNKGYKVRLVNMDVNPENAFQRMIRRFVSTGRIIPPEYLDRVGSNPSATYKTLKQEGVADGYAEIDNNGGFNEPKTVREISGENPLLGSSFDVPPGGRTRPDAIRSAEREGAEDLIQTEALADADMDLEVPIGQRLNEETGLVESTTVTLRDLKSEMDSEDAMIARLEFCTI
jgi:predicted kinase